MLRTFRISIDDRRYTIATMRPYQNSLESTIIEMFLIRLSLIRPFRRSKVLMPSGVRSSQAATSSINNCTQGRDRPETTVI